MQRTTLVTGGNGFLGRRLVRGLLDRGERVLALVRGESDASARSRLLRVLGEAYDRSELDVVAADLSRPEEVLAVADRGRLAEVWHLAARLDLSERRPEEMRRINVGGTAAVLALARRTGARHFHHVGTAYSCGVVDAPVPEAAPQEPARHRNSYERSKFDAELLVRQAAREGLTATFYRPSVVVGEAGSGVCEVYGAFYQFLRGLWLVRDALQFVLPIDRATTLDLVPVDRVAAAMLRLSADPRSVGRTFHLVSPRAPTFAEIETAAQAELDLGVADLRDEDLSKIPGPSRALLRAAGAMIPYMRNGPRFLHGEVDALLGPGWLAPEGEPVRWIRQLLARAREDRFGLSGAELDRERRLLRRLILSAAEDSVLLSA